MANLPFGLTVTRDSAARKREESAHTSGQYEQKLAEYREALENYKDCILAYSGKLDSYEKRSLDNQLSIVQTALDISYLKDKGDRSIELLEELKTEQMNKTLANLEHLITTVLDTNYKMDGLDQNVVNRLSEYMQELQKQEFVQNQQHHEELEKDMGILNRKVRKSNALLWFLFVFNLVSLAGLAFMILYIMELLPF
jgi:hypothetical protein